jgi:hypothetical protein
LNLARIVPATILPLLNTITAKPRLAAIDDAYAEFGSGLIGFFLASAAGMATAMVATAAVRPMASARRFGEVMTGRVLSLG